MGKYLDQAKAIRAAMDAAGKVLTDEQALAATALYRAWRSGETLAAGEIRRHGGALYRCIQAHTAQDNWTPAATPALWARISVEAWPAWKQPLPAEAYPLGAKVTHKGARWTSAAAGNVWEPGVYGWTKVG